MIDVLKRLAELDAITPAIDTKVSVVKQEQAIVVKENSVAECGMMPEMGMMSMPPEKPSTPATINITAGSGQELSDMLTTILTLAGQKQHEVEPHGEMPPPAVATTGDEGPSDSMRSVIDKLNPDQDDEEGSDQDDEEETDEAWDNAVKDPTDKDEFDPNQFANQENQPGAGDTPDGKARSRFQPATFESLMKEYKEFIGESADEDMEEEKEEDLEEGTCTSCHKDPCECENTEESTSESLDILKLAGLK